MSQLCYRALAITSIVGILLVVATPADTLNELFHWLGRWLSWPPSPDQTAMPYADKLVHATMFLCSAFFLVRAQFFPRLGRTGLFLLFLLFAVFTETLQFAVPGRSPSFTDLVADAAGIALGMLLAPALGQRWRQAQAS
ncbi:MAG: VanZ family protein [Parahaliea sp.]